MVILNKPPGDKRRMIVPPDVLRAVRAAFPQVEVRVHTGHNEEEGVQMQWLSRTDIFVTNIGSASFRMLFLPDGAKVCSKACRCDERWLQMCKSLIRSVAAPCTVAKRVGRLCRWCLQAP